MNRLCIRVAALLLFITSFNALAALPLDNSIAPMLQTVLPSVVNIRAQIKITDINTLRQLQQQQNDKKSNNDNNAQNQPVPDTYNSVASGVIVDDKNGYILTNAHVVTDAQSITVTLGDGRHFTARIIGSDKPSDIALLQIKAKNLSAAPLGDSSKLKVGDIVAAIGNPYGLSQTVTSGIISALGRTTLGIENFENFIQTDASINPGNSGGALINMSGQLIGINTAILAPAQGNIGIGFAIPVNMAKSVMLQLIEYGNVKRGVLGVGAQDISPELANAFNVPSSSGAIITMVYPNSPALLAGLQPGDIITSINDIPVKNASDVVNTVGFLRVDSKINMKVLRGAKPITVSITLTDPAKRKELIEKQDPFFNGTSLRDFTLTSPLFGNVQGVLVASVDPDTLAWMSDLRVGDVIVSVNHEKVATVNELKMAAAKYQNSILLNVLRGVGAVFVVLKKE